MGYSRGVLGGGGAHPGWGAQDVNFLLLLRAGPGGPTVHERVRDYAPPVRGTAGAIVFYIYLLVI